MSTLRQMTVEKRKRTRINTLHETMNTIMTMAMNGEYTTRISTASCSEISNQQTMNTTTHQNDVNSSEKCEEQGQGLHVVLPNHWRNEGKEENRERGQQVQSA